MILKYLFKDAPWYVRWPIYLGTMYVVHLGSAFISGINFSTRVDAYVDGRIENYAKPRRELRDAQFTSINSKLETQGRQIEAVHNYILYGKRPNN